ncbi:TRNA (guanine(37)-N1)-methyltransferase [Aphelenchoides besseyi]|nr:TRNA (guanine(37)-N1)-methyltransferase [Aphelenchoides besseyi]
MATSESTIFFPPIAVRGIKELKPELFRKTIDVPCIKVPANKVGRITGLKVLQNLGLRKILRLKRIQDGADKQEKYFLFDPDLMLSTENANEKILEAVKQVADLDVQIESKPITLEYDDWDVKRCLRAVLPEHLDFSGHTQVGHILHLNLREELMDYRFIIARILLDKINYAKTVVNKVEQINTEFRFFDLELLAGEPDYVATVSENNLKFKLDFSKVFWNSRLNQEHKFIVNEISSSARRSVLFDVFAGVGPFSVPATFARNTEKVYANDLNPISVDYLRENIKLNKVSTEKIEVFNMDGSEFIKQVFPSVFELHAKTANDEKQLDFHFVMNLPALALTFLPSFIGVLSDNQKSLVHNCNFIVHCHTFVKATEDQLPDEWYRKRAQELTEEQLQPYEPEIQEIRYVRNVAPKKNIFMLSCWRCRCSKLLSRTHSRDFSTTPRRQIEWRVPWEYIQVRRKFMEFVANRFSFDRVRMLGPDFACLEWLMNCGATTVQMSDGTKITTQKEMQEFIGSHGFDVKNKNLKAIANVLQLPTRELEYLVRDNKAYSRRWKNVPQVFIQTVDASDSVIADPGFQYFVECRQIEKMDLNFCQYFGDIAIQHLCMGRVRISLKELEIIINSHITDAAFLQIAKLQALRRAHFYFNPYVASESLAMQRLRTAIPRLYVTYPTAVYFGTGKEK